MKARWTKAARQDRRDIIDYIADRDVAAALRIGDRFVEAISMLEHYPFAARPGRMESTRELIIADTRFIAVYRVDHATPVIIRLIHISREWPAKDC